MHNTQKKGRASELRVACDLNERGYDIFIQFGTCSCDLVAIRDGRPFRVEVKSGYFRGAKVGKPHYLDIARADVLAVVYPTHIRYIGLPDAPAAPIGDTLEWAVEYIGDMGQ